MFWPILEEALAVETDEAFGWVPEGVVAVDEGFETVDWADAGGFEGTDNEGFEADADGGFAASLSSSECER